MVPNFPILLIRTAILAIFSYRILTFATKLVQRYSLNCFITNYMNDHRKIFIAFIKLGDFISGFLNGSDQNAWHQKLEEAIALAKQENGWFTREHVIHALSSWAELLTHKELSKWLSYYDPTKNRPKTVAIIMAGNIPLVGFHDFISVLITGNKALVKLSSNDTILISFIRDYLIHLEPLLKDRIIFSDDKLKDFDVVIATGSDNTARYFEYYFRKSPHIIRKNRNSIAVLTGQESPDDLEALGRDIFLYYGLGCRNVSKIFVPKNYDFAPFFKAIYIYSDIIHQHKYANNYDYNKAVYLMSNFKLLDNGFLILKEDTGYSSPIATLFYERYDDLSALSERLTKDRDLLQCIVGKDTVAGQIPFGSTQRPSLYDYADGVDTVDFLLKT